MERDENYWGKLQTEIVELWIWKEESLEITMVQSVWGLRISGIRIICERVLTTYCGP